MRFGIDMKGNHMAWKHDPKDEKPSRVNVLRPNERHPENDGVIDARIDDRPLWEMARGSDDDADEGRAYWAYYQGPAGDRWYTLNPSIPSDDLVIRRVRSRRFGPFNRRLVKSIERGGRVRAQAIHEASTAADEARLRRKAQENQGSQDGPDDRPVPPDADV